MATIEPGLYKPEDLDESKEDYFPLVMVIETNYPKTYTGKAKKSVQMIYGSLSHDGEAMTFNCLQKKFLFNNKMFNLGEIYGSIKGDTANISSD